MERSRRACGAVDSRLQESREVFVCSVLHRSSVFPAKATCGPVRNPVCAGRSALARLRRLLKVGGSVRTQAASLRRSSCVRTSC